MGYVGCLGCVGMCGDVWDVWDMCVWGRAGVRACGRVGVRASGCVGGLGEGFLIPLPHTLLPLADCVAFSPVLYMVYPLHLGYPIFAHASAQPLKSLPMSTYGSGAPAVPTQLPGAAYSKPPFIGLSGFAASQ